MNTNTAQNRSSIFGKIIFFVLLSFIVFSITNRVFGSPFEFDESVNLIVSRVFFQTGIYSNFEKVFDPVITTGPTVLIPSALTLFSNNIFFPRLIILLYSLLLIYIVISKIQKSISQRIIFLSLLCLTPFYFYFSAHVLGEIPAVFFALTGLYFLNGKKYFLSGLFLMLSIFTKNIFLLSLVPAAYLLYLQRKELSVKKIFLFIIPFAIITLGWELYKLQTFNYSLRAYYDSTYQLLRYNKGLTKIHPEYFMDRLKMLKFTFGINGLVVLFSMILVSISSFQKAQGKLIKSIAIFILVYLAYYFIIGSTSWYRHFFPVIVLFMIVLSHTLSSIKVNKIYIVLFITLLWLVQQKSNFDQDYLFSQNLLPLFDQTGTKLFTQSDVLKQQLTAAKFIQTNLPTQNIAGFGWYNAPEISYIANKQILRSPEDKDVSYLIRHPYGSKYDSVIVNLSSKDTLLETPLYKIYKKHE